MYSRILVPLDGSKRAEAILGHVEDLAAGHDATVILMQVVEPTHINVRPEGPYTPQTMTEYERSAREAETYLAGLQGQLREMGIASTLRVEYGPVVAAIIRVADEEGVDLIALASHGRGALSRVFYGSVAAGLLQRVDRPLLLIRARQG